MRADLCFVLIRSFFHIGLHEKLATGTQQTSDLVQQIRVHDKAFGVFLFPPRIGEMQKEGFDGTVWPQASQGFARIGVERSDARMQARFA